MTDVSWTAKPSSHQKMIKRNPTCQPRNVTPKRKWNPIRRHIQLIYMITSIFASIDTSVLDRMNIPGKWQDFCQFFRLDLAKITSGTTYVVPGMIRAAMLYQLFGTFCMLEMETIQGGGWNADSMGLGKVSNITLY